MGSSSCDPDSSWHLLLDLAQELDSSVLLDFELKLEL